MKANRKIEDYLVFDNQKIASHFYTIGFSNVANRYFPQSYAKLKPIQQFADEYIDLPCEICNKDWIKEIMKENMGGIYVMAIPEADEKFDTTEDVLVVCKGECDTVLSQRLQAQGYTTGWKDIGDLCNPILFLRNILTYTNLLHSRDKTISATAHKKMKRIFMAAAQRVLREVTDEDRAHFSRTVEIENLGF